MTSRTSYKICLIGNSGVGKTTTVKRVRTGEFEKTHVPTLGVEVHPLNFRTTNGEYVLNIWDCAGVEKFGGIASGYYTGAEGFIIMFDVTDRDSHDSVERWYASARKTGNQGSENIVILGNKIDVPVRRVPVKARKENSKKDGVIGYYDTSYKSNYHFDKPFLLLLRTLTGIADLKFVDAPAISPPEISFQTKIPDFN